MSGPSAALQALVVRVLAREARVAAGAALPAQLGQVFTRLQEVTAAMVGDVGYLSLMARAVRMSRPQFAWLPVLPSSPVVQAEPTFPRAAWQAHVESEGPEAAIAGATLLFANVLGLLASFIGEDFTFRLTRRAWPDDGSSVDRSVSEEI